jgi:hypothetical protein
MLVSFQDITDIKIRNALQKMANSSNTAERSGALTSIVVSTVRAKDIVQIRDFYFSFLILFLVHFIFNFCFHFAVINFLFLE